MTYHLGAQRAVWLATLSVAPGIIMYRGAKAAIPPTPKVRSSEERALGILTGILILVLRVIDWYERVLRSQLLGRC